MNSIDYSKLLEEAQVIFSRSGGKGGQNVNKVETKVSLVLNIPNSQALPEQAKTLLLKNLKNKLDISGNIRVTSSKERYQIANRQQAEKLLIKLLQHGLKEKKRRKATKPSKGAREARLSSKRHRAHKKKLRTQSIPQE